MCAAQHGLLSNAGTQLLLSRLIKPFAKAKLISKKKTILEENNMNKAIIVVGTGLLLLATAPSVPASPLMPVGSLAAAATTDEAVSQVRWRHCYRWHCRHYGWYRGRHYGWYRHHHRYWR